MQNPMSPGRINRDSIGEQRLFNLKVDPFEKNNLYKYPKYRQTCFDFEKILLKLITNSAKLKPSQKEVKIKKETKKLLESLGYL